MAADGEDSCASVTDSEDELKNPRTTTLGPSPLKFEIAACTFMSNPIVESYKSGRGTSYPVLETQHHRNIWAICMGPGGRQIVEKPGNWVGKGSRKLHLWS